MKVQTCHTIGASPQAVWPLLCNSAMELPPSLPFLLGIPRPERCYLPSGVGGVGQSRECISNKGSIRQRILEWEEGRRLRFEMKETDLFFRDYVRTMVDSFDVEGLAPDRTRVTRTTEITLAGGFKTIKALAVWFGVKMVHRYVFKKLGRTRSRLRHRAV